MFGSNNTHETAAPARPKASDVAKMEGGALTRLIVTAMHPLTFYVFVGDVSIFQDEVESLSIHIEDAEAGPIVGALLVRKVTTALGEKKSQTVPLLPGTVEIIALGRRIIVSCERTDSLDTVYIGLGLRPDGTCNDVQGAALLQFVFEDGLMSAKLGWNDGETEELLPQ